MSHNEELYELWNKRWQGLKSFQTLTPLGRLMFRAKKKALSRLIKTITVKDAIEVGCGLGYTIQAIKEPGLNYVGIDVSPYAVETCRKKGLKVELKKLEDVIEKYDLVSCDGMLEHFLNFAPYAKHLMRISNRYVLLIQPNHGSFWGKIFVLLSEILRRDENVFEYNYRIKDFISFFEENGFILEKQEPVFLDVFRLLLFKKTDVT